MSTRLTFLCTVTLTCIFASGHHEEGKSFDNYQLWYALVVGSPDDGKTIDNVQPDEYKTTITFWERKENFPVPHSVVVVTGEAAFFENAPEPVLKIRASQLRV